MKKQLLLSLLVAPSLLYAQTTIFTENFDSYISGDYAAVSSTYMSTWSGNFGAGSDDCLITNAESSSPNNSILINGPQAGGTIDAVIEFPAAYTAGRYEFSMKYKVAAGMGGYFNIQAFTSGFGNPPAGYWMAETFLASDGTGTMTAGGQVDIPFNYTNGAWIDIMIECDLDSDWGRVFIDGNEVGTGFQWSLTTSGVDNVLSFGAINLYSSSPVGSNCEYYVDDIMLVETTPGNGLSEQELASSLLIMPNPSNGKFEIRSSIALENATISIVDLSGKEVYASTTDLTSNGMMSFDLNLLDGLYFVNISNGNHTASKKVVIKN